MSQENEAAVAAEEDFSGARIRALQDEQARLYGEARKIANQQISLGHKFCEKYARELNLFTHTSTRKGIQFQNFEKRPSGEVNVCYSRASAYGFFRAPVELIMDPVAFERHLVQTRDTKLELARKELAAAETKYATAQKKLNKIKAEDTVPQLYRTPKEGQDE